MDAAILLFTLSRQPLCIQLDLQDTMTVFAVTVLPIMHGFTRQLDVVYK